MFCAAYIFRMNAGFVSCRGVCIMVMRQFSCGKGGNENGKSEEHCDAFPSEMSFVNASSVDIVFPAAVSMVR